ncbi:MAG: Trm112 family protein, partial [Bryobacteraceae bacterium]
MDTRLLDILRCSKCLSELILTVYESARGSTRDVRNGLLTCPACSLRYAVWRAVPRMNLEEDFRLPPGFVSEWGPLLFAEARSEPALHKMKKFETNAYDVSWALDRDGTFHWGG